MIYVFFLTWLWLEPLNIIRLIMIWLDCRTPVVELIMDELSYDKDLISPFLQVIFYKYRSCTSSWIWKGLGVLVPLLAHILIFVSYSLRTLKWFSYLSGRDWFFFSELSCFMIKWNAWGPFTLANLLRNLLWYNGDQLFMFVTSLMQLDVLQNICRPSITLDWSWK